MILLIAVFQGGEVGAEGLAEIGGALIWGAAREDEGALPFFGRIKSNLPS